MQTCPYLEAQVASSISDRLGAADRPGGAVERRQEPVAGRIDLAAPETPQLSSDQLVVLREQLFPRGVPKLGGSLCRSDNVGEEDGREYPIRFGRAACPGNELLHLPQDRFDVAGPDVRVDPWDLHITGAGDLLRKIASAFARREAGA